MMSFLLGALAMACWVAGLFFLRFWTTLRDRLFLFFAIAFWTLAAQWTAMSALDVRSELVYFLYVPRLLAFLLIIVGIIDKNRRP